MLLQLDRVNCTLLTFRTCQDMPWNNSSKSGFLVGVTADPSLPDSRKKLCATQLLSSLMFKVLAEAHHKKESFQVTTFSRGIWHSVDEHTLCLSLIYFLFDELNDIFVLIMKWSLLRTKDNAFLLFSAHLICRDCVFCWIRSFLFVSAHLISKSEDWMVAH